MRNGLKLKSKITIGSHMNVKKIQTYSAIATDFIFGNLDRCDDYKQ